MKFFQFACIFVALFAIAYASNASWGKRVSGDYLLANDLVRYNGTAGVYSSMNFDFPRSGQTNTRNISAIFVYDKYANQRGATPSLWSGGPGFRYAQINFKSQYGGGINSTVEIYGR